MSKDWDSVTHIKNQIDGACTVVQQVKLPLAMPKPACHIGGPVQVSAALSIKPPENAHTGAEEGNSNAQVPDTLTGNPSAVQAPDFGMV